MNISKTQTDKIVVGTNDVSYVPPDTSPTGTAVLNGPVYVGKTAASPGYEAVLNVASNSAPQNPLDVNPACNAPLAVKVDGDSKFVGDGKTGPDAIVVVGDMFVTGAVDCGNKGKLAARFGAADGRPKPFDIQHPTKGEGHRLRYACIEGPEVGVYYRGRLKGSNIIELPYYWKDLVHEDSITVQLQPIGKNQNLVVESFSNEYVVVEIGANQDFLTNEILIDCFYHVYGERKDINPLITEYEGDTWQDYPDPNFDPNKVDEDKRNLNDPRFAGPPNTFTN
tara:strand:+ start:214 stop:1056 length:843 start_codon:yes stop_codon:yes gene_type:complete